MSASQIRDALATLTGSNRLDASAIKNLLSGTATAWQLISANYNISAGDKIAIDCSSPITLTLPSSPATGAEVEFIKYAGSSAITIATNGSNFEGNTVGSLFYTIANSAADTADKLIYINSTIGWVSTRKKIARPISLTFASAGDINGLIYYLGTSALTGSFVNPATSGAIAVLASSTGGGTASLTTNRANDEWFSGNVAGSWIAYNLSNLNRMSVTNYVLRNRSTATSAALRNWVLEGTNVVSTFDIAGVNAATWTAIDTRTSDATLTTISQYYPITCNGSSARFQYLRLRNSGVNSSGSNELCLNEIEFYGSLLSV